MKTVALALVITAASALPAQPTDPKDPGSAVYTYTEFAETFTLAGRKVEFHAPKERAGSPERAPLVVFGHGQAIDADGYRETIRHLVGKGVAVLIPAYDTGFFDQDWKRMASDYAAQTAEALKRYPTYVDPAHVIYAGHSKGGYVGLMAAGLSPHPQSAVFFAPAGYDADLLRSLDPAMPLTLVWGKGDSVVSEASIQEIYRNAPSTHKQLIEVAAYPELEPGHFFPLSKKYFFGGRNGISPHHYFGVWKWLLGAAWDDGFLYGPEALVTGVPGLAHTVTRSW